MLTRKKGVLIALFGPDGGGKSTVADLLDNVIQTKGLATERFHWRPRILPGLKGSEQIDTNRPDGYKTRPWLFSVGMHFYILFDFLLGYLIKLYPFLNRGGVIVYERYFYDLLFHPRRYKLARISWLVNWLVKIVPQPHFIVLLTGTPSLIYSRKPELPLEEIARQQVLMEDYFDSFSSVIRVDTTASLPEEAACQIFEQLEKTTGLF